MIWTATTRRTERSGSETPRLHCYHRRDFFGSAWRGSARIEWLHTLGGKQSNLRLHTQLFSGYGDSLVDYNRKRTVFTLGLSLVDF